MVFDMTEHESFDNLDRWVQDANKYSSDDVVKAVFANKCDDEDNHQVSEQEIEHFEETTGIPVIKTSAKTAQNVFDAFVIVT